MLMGAQSANLAKRGGEERLSAFSFFFVEADNKLPIGVSMKVNWLARSKQGSDRWAHTNGVSHLKNKRTAFRG